MRGKRIRMDFTIFTPELRNNDIISKKDYYVPQGYCKNFHFEESSTVFAKYIGSNMHSFFLGDYLEIWGMFDASITVGPVPAGSYEVRIGYRVDAVLVCLVGGAMGIALSMMIAFALQLFLPGWEIGFSPMAILTAFLCSTFTGILFGWLPARNAARLDPVDALARE